MDMAASANPRTRSQRARSANSMERFILCKRCNVYMLMCIDITLWLARVVLARTLFSHSLSGSQECQWSLSAHRIEGIANSKGQCTSVPQRAAAMPTCKQISLIKKTGHQVTQPCEYGPLHPLKTSTGVAGGAAWATTL
eukprot:2215252-Amphidinium_carterae.1